MSISLPRKEIDKGSDRRPGHPDPPAPDRAAATRRVGRRPPGIDLTGQRSESPPDAIRKVDCFVIQFVGRASLPPEAAPPAVSPT
jgi:hypothetical protein